MRNWVTAEAFFTLRKGSSPLVTSNGVPEPRSGNQAGPHGSLLVVAVESQHLFIGGAVRA